jgi:putative colanic acid biosysnthesis UDP-glucose lipid carrier transferase
MLPRGLLKEHFQILAIFLRGLDAQAIIIAGWVAYFYKFDTLSLNFYYAIALGIAGISTLVIFHFLNIYQSIRAQTLFHHLTKLSQAVFILLIFLAGLAFITKMGEVYSRAWFVEWAIFSLLLLFSFRCCLLLCLRFMRARGWNERCVIVIGSGALGSQLVETVQQALWTGFRIVAIFNDAPEKGAQKIAEIPIKETPVRISEYLKQSKESIDEIWLALPLHAEHRVKEILYELRHHVVTIRYVLDLFGLDLTNHSITHLAGFPTLNLNASPMIGFNRLTKAVEDRVVAAIILMIISPLFLFIMLAVKFSSRGPIFFKQQRHGWDGRIIKVYKFRTMIEHKDDWDWVTQASVDDKRVTPLGRFLRRTSLDELPQFLNVLQGRMSIVGPRPHAIAHNEFYKDSIKAYMQRHKVKPGITGWAQINGFRGETDTLDKMQKRVEYDLHYIENWSLAFDLKIIFLTLFRGFVGKNAY